MKRVQHRISETWKECNMKRVQHKKVQHEENAT